MNYKDIIKENKELKNKIIKCENEIAHGVLFMLSITPNYKVNYRTNTGILLDILNTVRPDLYQKISNDECNIHELFEKEFPNEL